MGDGVVLFLFLTVSLGSSVFAYRQFYVKEKHSLILYMENENVTITCTTKRDMSYCRLLDPKGNKHSFTDTLLQDGNCTTHILGTKETAGTWVCEVGYSVGELEQVEKYELRLSDEVAAVMPEVHASKGMDVTLLCVTTREAKPLNVCRIQTPSGQAFLIDRRVTAKKKIMGRFYFPHDRSTDRGECAVTIKSVTKYDAGKWTCELGLANFRSASIQLNVTGLRFDTANIVANVFVVLVVVGFMACLFLVFKHFKNKAINLSPPISDGDLEMNSFSVSPEEPMTPNTPSDLMTPPVVITPASPPDPSSPVPSGSTSKLMPKC